MQPGFPQIGTLYRDGVINGIKVYSQPNGPGTHVSPLPPTQSPQQNMGYPQIPFAYFGFLSLGCGHWVNSIEVNEEYDPYTQLRAAILCCPLCGYIQEIVEPATDWFNKFYSLYSIGGNEKNYT